MDNKTSQVEAVVTSIIRRGRKEYVVTITKSCPPELNLSSETTVTFSLSDYESDHAPRPGQVVLLSDIEKFAKGWRARSAKPIRA